MDSVEDDMLILFYSVLAKFPIQLYWRIQRWQRENNDSVWVSGYFTRQGENIVHSTGWWKTWTFMTVRKWEISY